MQAQDHSRGDVIGRPLPRPETARLVRGRGSYTDDLTLPFALHAAFLRRPHGHAVIKAIDVAAARALPGVAAVLNAADIAEVCAGWRGVLPRFASLRSPVQTALADGRTTYQGEPVAIVLAVSRAVAEDSAELIDI